MKKQFALVQSRIGLILNVIIAFLRTESGYRNFVYDGYRIADYTKGNFKSVLANVLTEIDRKRLEYTRHKQARLWP